MAPYVVTAAEMRQLDQWTITRHRTPGAVLMQRAGEGAAAILVDRFPEVRDGRVIVVAGRGNNGGDGFVIARTLRRAGVAVEVILLARAPDVTGDAAAALELWRAAGGRYREAPRESDLVSLRDELATATVVVDAIFGTGLKRPVEGRHARAIEAMRDCGRPVFAVDLPSGLDADRGVPLGVAVRAEATATFGFLKFALASYPGLDRAGVVDVVAIGIPSEAIAAVAPRVWLQAKDEVAPLVPHRARDAHKGTTGHVVIVAGSLGHTGAARLAARASLRSGAGLITLAGPSSLNAVLSSGGDEWMTAAISDAGGHVRFVPSEVRRILADKRAVVVGPGLGTHPAAARLVHAIVRESTVPVVVDADALTCLVDHLALLRRAHAPVVVTPHPGEMARLIGTDAATVQADRLGTARRFAESQGCIVVLKGARSLIAAPDGQVWINPTGNPGMASGGMGDALAGMLGALLGQRIGAIDAARLAVFAHGFAADRVAERQGEIGMIASDVIDELPRVWKELGAARGGYE